MTTEDLLLKEGAFYFGPRLIYKQKDIGVRSSSGLVLLPEGEEIAKKLADITDVEVKAPKKPKAKKDEPAETASLDELLDD